LGSQKVPTEEAEGLQKSYCRMLKSFCPSKSQNLCGGCGRPFVHWVTKVPTEEAEGLQKSYCKKLKSFNQLESQSPTVGGRGLLPIGVPKIPTEEAKRLEKSLRRRQEDFFGPFGESGRSFARWGPKGSCGGPRGAFLVLLKRAEDPLPLGLTTSYWRKAKTFCPMGPQRSLRRERRHFLGPFGEN
jgi:hypothetical protein